ncbi:MAG TPA: tellurite resistance/C4-dicarboxylate transporter family protein [Trebonia sp.]
MRDLDPSYFALVMATGIVSRAMRLDGAVALSDALLVVALAVFVVMSGVYAMRLVRYRREFAADARDPRRAFGFFTFGAAAGVLAAPLAASGDTAVAAVLLVLAVTGWLLLSYVVPMLIGGDGEETVRPPLAGANGTWFVWAVGAQAVAVAATAFPPPVPEALAALGICCWVIGVVLYVVVAVLVATARLEFPLRPGDPTAPYWVFMGATAISVLAGSQILRLRGDPLAPAVHAAASGLSVMMWAFGTWLIPLLVALAGWRHLLCHVSLRYEPAFWAVVFPVGMYGVASRELGVVLHVSWLVTLGRYEAWVALATWMAVVAAMAASTLHRRRDPDPERGVA